MSRIRRVNVCTLVALVAAAGCRSHPEATWPSDPADLTGQVLDVRGGGGTLGTLRSDTRGYGNGIDGRRLRIRVLSARSQEHGPEAYVMVDGVTQVARANGTPGGNEHPDLEGAFVRVWLRSKVFSSSPSDLSGTARLIAIDSTAGVTSGR